jgi:hypothetical protein
VASPAPAPPPAAPEEPEQEVVPPAEPAQSSTSVGSPAAVIAFTPESVRPSGDFYGSRDGQLFVRTPRDELVLLPVARLEMDANSVMTDEANASGSTLALGLARVDLAGWAYAKVYFDFSADFASGPSLRHVDNYVAIEPWGDRAILQIGQFDAPFSLENRTSDRYLDFGERGAAVRDFAISENKDQGIMVRR